MRVLTGLLALAAAGCASSPSADARTLLSAPGPLPIRTEFSVDSDRQMLWVSGSAFAGADNVRLEIQVLVDGATVASGRVFSNGADTHRTLVFPAVPLSLAPGRHTLELRPGNAETYVDPEDRLEATLVER